MRIYSLRDGRVLFEDSFNSIKKTAEHAAAIKINLPFADFRKADLRQAALDGLNAPGACFWGANLAMADLSQSFLKSGDFRLAVLEKTCLAKSVCDEGDFRGAQFSSTLLMAASLKNCRFSGSAILRQDMTGIGSLKGSAYDFLGETECPLTFPPVYLRGLGEEIMILDRHVIIGTKLYDAAAMPRDFSHLIEAIGNFRSTTLGYCAATGITPKKL